MSDSNFSLNLHGNAKLVDIVDRDWQLEQLGCDEKIIESRMPPIGSSDTQDEVYGTDEQPIIESGKWQDLDATFLDDYHINDAVEDASAALQHAATVSRANL